MTKTSFAHSVAFVRAAACAPCQTGLRAGGAALLGAALLWGCTGLPSAPPAAPVTIKLIAFNDFHGNLEPPRIAISALASLAAGITPSATLVPAGGAAYMASAIASLKAQNPHHAVISAGDMIGATPLVSALFLDEPTIEAVNAMKIDFNAVGNHEFDKGRAELLRMARGGCDKNTLREPCLVNKAFAGANFGYLAANVVQEDGKTLFPATGIKEFGSGAGKVKVGIIGMTLKGTPGIVSPEGVKGLDFKDEAETANALVPGLKAQGADVIVVLLHEGGATTGGYNDKSCPNLGGDIVPILERLSPAIHLVVSGHTHRSYVCDYSKINPAKNLLLTSAGLYGTLLTDINIAIDPVGRKVLSIEANNIIVQGEAFTNSAGAIVPVNPLFQAFAKDAGVDKIVRMYAAAAAPLAQRVVGTVTASLTRDAAASGENALGNVIADSQLAATRAAERGGAQIALMNPGGVRTNLLVPASGGAVTYGQIFSVQPFGNSIVVKSFTGAQLKAVLEQQFSGANAKSPRVLMVSSGFGYSYDLQQPDGNRVSAMALNGVPVLPTTVLRVAMNSFLATGGDGFAAFTQGTNSLGGELDVDAFEAYIRANAPLPPAPTNRIRKL